MQKCCLWIGGKKVSDLKGIRENFNITDVRGYYLAGTLTAWLKMSGYGREASLIDSIPKNTNPDKMLSDIFFGRYVPPVYHKVSENAIRVFNRNFGGGKNGSFGGSFNGSFARGNFKAGSYKLGSYRLGSGRGYHEYEYEFSKGSYRKGSYRLGSYNRGSYKAGSYAFGSYSLGSYNFGSFGSFNPFGRFGSFNPIDYASGYTEFQLKVYFTSEPMNLYGYGINLV